MFNTNGIWQIGPMIITWGTDEQKARWLPSILEAHDHWCQGFSEPDAGNDLANLRTTAILRRRPLRGERPEDLDLHRPPGQVGAVPAAHRSHGHRAGRQARGHHRLHRGHGDPGHRVPARSGTWPARRCSTRSSSPTPGSPPTAAWAARARVGWWPWGPSGFERVGHRRPALDPRRRPAGHDRGGPLGQPRGPGRPGASRSAWPEAWTEIELAKLLSLRALSRIIKGEKPWPEVQFAKIAVGLPGPGPGRAGGRPAGAGRGAGPGRARRGGPRQVDPPLLVPALQHHRRRLHRGPEEHHRRPGHQAPRPVPQVLSPAVAVSPARDPRVALPHRRGPADLAPGRRRSRRRPRAARHVGGGGPRRRRRRRRRRGAGRTSDPRRRLLPVLGVRRPGRAGWPSGWAPAGADRATRASAGRCPRCSWPSWPRPSPGGGLGPGARGRGPRPWPRSGGSRRRARKPAWSHRPAERRPVPLRRPVPPGRGGPLGVPGLPHLRRLRQRPAGPSRPGARRAPRPASDAMLAPMTEVAAADPANAWFPIARTPTSSSDGHADNRMVAYPYTKLMISIMDVDMAAAVLLASDAKADELGVPLDQPRLPAGLGLRRGSPLRGRAPRAVALAGHGGGRSGGPGRRPASGSTTWPTSTCTRASPARSAFAVDALGLDHDAVLAGGGR